MTKHIYIFLILLTMLSFVFVSTALASMTCIHHEGGAKYYMTDDRKIEVAGNYGGTLNEMDMGSHPETWLKVSENTSSPPGAATLVSPSGTITDTTPTYTWNAVSGATWYKLYVCKGTSGSVHDQWYEASSITSGAICSVTPGTMLGSGDHTWWVQTWNSSGFGPWSSGMNFTVGSSGPPGAATLMSPSGTITDTTPTYTWNAVSEATWYRLYVRKGTSGNVHDQWYEASSITSGAICSVTPGTMLGSGDHTWWVQTWNQYGYGPWSSGMNFLVSHMHSGFNEQFDKGNAVNWDQDSGAWYVVSNKAWYFTEGVAGKSAVTTYNKNVFSDIDYKARLWRYGQEADANELLIRVSGAMMDNGLPRNCYLFDYSRSGYFRVWKIKGGSMTPLQNWTYSSAIQTGYAWNELRVYAKGTYFEFYINGTLVWSGNDNSLSSGRVGLGMFRSNTHEATQFFVDWATLDIVK